MRTKIWRNVGFLTGGTILLIGAVVYARAADAPQPEPDERAPDDPADVPAASVPEQDVPTAITATTPTTPPRAFRLSPHFTYGEFWQKQCKNLAAAPYPVAWIGSRLQPLVTILERIRHELGGPVMTVTSGYRSPAYNRCIGGARASQHTQGRAVDFKVAGKSPREVATVIRRLHATGAITIGGLGVYRSWIHLDTRPRTDRTYATWTPLT